MRFRSRAAVGIAFGLCLLSQPSSATTVRIRLVRPPNGDALVRELTARTAGELVAAGFSVELQDLPTVEDPIHQPTEGAPVAASILIDDRVEITVGGQVVYRAAIARDQIAADDGGRVLAAAAVRAVAALQTALADQQTPAAPPAPAMASGGTASTLTGVSVEATPAARRIGLGIGASVLYAGSWIGPIFAPVARLSYQVAPRLTLGLRLSVLGTEPTVTAAAGSGRVGQDLALADVLIAFRPGRRIHPLLVGGAGLYHVVLDGTGVSPYVGQTDSLWAAAASVGAGLSIDLTRRVSAAFECETLWAWPEPSVAIGGVDAGRMGRPSLVNSLGLVVSL
jgi:hypothetical protein